MKRWHKAFAIVLPILVMGSWVLIQERTISTGARVHLKIQGFDPRDLLSGHYLRFRVDYQDASLCRQQERVPYCVCLDTNGDNHPAHTVWSGGCEARPSCALWLKGQCDWSGFNAGIDRFYFPEEFSNQLAVVPPNSTVEVALDGTGRGVVVGLYVDGETLVDYLRHLENKIRE
jgi:uncharacterized membrane-anchored protein